MLTDTAGEAAPQAPGPGIGEGVRGFGPPRGGETAPGRPGKAPAKGDSGRGRAVMSGVPGDTAPEQRKVGDRSRGRDAGRAPKGEVGRGRCTHGVGDVGRGLVLTRAMGETARGAIDASTSPRRGLCLIATGRAPAEVARMTSCCFLFCCFSSATSRCSAECEDSSIFRRLSPSAAWAPTNGNDADTSLEMDKYALDTTGGLKDRASSATTSGPGNGLRKPGTSESCEKSTDDKSQVGDTQPRLVEAPDAVPELPTK